MSGHSRISASASSRWIYCPGSIELIEQLRKAGLIPQESTNPAAELGTAVHYIIEQVLLGKSKFRDFRRKKIKTDGMTQPATMTAKEIASARLCVRYVEDRLKVLKRAKMFPERKYDLSNVYDAPLGGTSDVTIIENRGVLEIVDYKNGRIFVSAIDNSQLKIYALGAYYAFRSKYKFKKIRVTIVQPNATILDGPIRSEEFSVEDLLLWERKVLVVALGYIRSKKAPLVPDKMKQCYWCEAKPHCTAYLKNKPKIVKDVIASIIPTNKYEGLPDPESLSPEELANALQNADSVIEFYLGCKKLALARLEEDESSITGWGLQPKLGNRKFVDDKTLKAKLKKKRISLEDLVVHEDRTMSVTELEKHVINDLKWSKDDVVAFMDSVTERNHSGFVLKRVESAENDFAEFTQTETSNQDTQKRVKRSKKNGHRST